MPFRNALLVLVCLALHSVSSLALDWPQWRGKNRDGKSTDTGLLEEWPAGGPPLAWSASGLGRGFSSVSIDSGRIFTMGDLGNDQQVIALREDDGSLLWKTRIGPAWTDASLYPGSRSTPTVDGERIYALGTEGDLACLRAATGEILWTRSLSRDFGGAMMIARAGVEWKFAESPLVDGDRVSVAEGWRRGPTATNDKMRWEPSQLTKVVPDLVAQAAEPSNMLS